MRWTCVRLSPPLRTVFGSIVISSPSHSAKAPAQTGLLTPAGGFFRSSTTSKRKAVRTGSLGDTATALPLDDVQQALAGPQQDDGDELDRERRRHLERDQEPAVLGVGRRVQSPVGDDL